MWHYVDLKKKKSEKTNKSEKKTKPNVRWSLVLYITKVSMRQLQINGELLLFLFFWNLKAEM